MTQCTVEYYGPALLVRFNDGKSLLLQTDYDKASFFYSLGLIPYDTPACADFGFVDISDINQCHDDYYSIARYD